MSVGVGVGLIFLAREGLSLASLKTMEEEQEEQASGEDVLTDAASHDMRRSAPRAGAS